MSSQPARDVDQGRGAGLGLINKMGGASVVNRFDVDPATGEVLKPKATLGLTPELLAKLNETDVKKAAVLVKAGIITTGAAQKLLGIPEEEEKTPARDSDPTLFSMSIRGVEQ